MMRSVAAILPTALLSLSLFVSAAMSAEESALPSEPEAKSPASESVQSQIDQHAADKVEEKRKAVIADARVAIEETEKALKVLEEKKNDDALASLEIATGKLESILARDPDLALAPVELQMLTYDLIANPDTVREVIDEAEEYLEDGEVQKARPLVANLASEIVFRTTNIPLATYPETIKEITPLIDEGKIDEAKERLRAVLSTLVITTEEVIPLPKLRAEQLLTKAESLAENEKRTTKDHETLNELLKEARTQLELGELLGYGKKAAYRPMYEQLNEIEQKTKGGKGGQGWFDKIKQQLSELL